MSTRSPELESALREANAIRFLCSGNVVRSAFAELYARHLSCPLPVDSRATRFQNDALFPETSAALLDRDVDPRLLAGFRPRLLGREAPEPRRLVFAMSREHLETWRATRKEDGKAFLLLEVEGQHGELADPVLEGASFPRTFERIAGVVRTLVEVLRDESG